MRVLHLDNNHELLIRELADLGIKNDIDYTSSKEDVEAKIHLYDGVVIRSRFKIDSSFLDKAINLKFIARVGAGLESIDCDYALKKGVNLFSAPEGNRNAVGEHALGMLLNLFNKLNTAHQSIVKGKWLREEHRGIELEGKTVGLIGYGNMGKSFAEKLKGFNCKVICYDIKPNLGDENATQVSLYDLQMQSDVISLHTPWTIQTNKMVNEKFINAFKKPIWIVNTARGKSIVTNDLVKALNNGKVLGAALDVLEYEKLSFESLFDNDLPTAFKYLLNSKNVLLSPHIEGWTVESKEKLAQVIVNKIKAKFFNHE